MVILFRTAVSLLAVLMALPLASGTSPSPTESVPLTSAEEAVVAEAYAIYAAAGFDLPADVRIEFHGDVEGCDGNLGLFTPSADLVQVCWRHEHPGVEARVQLQALVHELAHAWVHHNVDETTRAAYLERVGLSSWQDGVPWGERGIEHAAELIMATLLDPPVTFIDLDVLDCNERHAAFELLTGALSALDC